LRSTASLLHLNNVCVRPKEASPQRLAALHALKFHLNLDFFLVRFPLHPEVVRKLAHHGNRLPPLDRRKHLGFENRFGYYAANTTLNNVLGAEYCI
jgi:hypothetical protein